VIDVGSVVCVARTGKGRFSTVYYSREKRSDAPCAVKVITLSAAQGGNKTSYSKCLKEVGLLRNLAHPNIIKYSDSFLEEDVLFIVLEWAAGGDLKNLISKIRREQTQLEEHTVWSYFSQCCEAVHHMHGQRIIHRDIKPSNVFVMDDGRLKLGDLGLGRYLDLQSILAFSQVGTPLYMSPEVLRGEGHDFASDIWSLGCVLYEMAMLRSPFQQKGLTMDKLFLKIVQGDYVSMNQETETYTAQMSALIDSMLKTDPSTRPAIDRIAAAALVCRATQTPGKTNQLDDQFELSSSGVDQSLGSTMDGHDQSLSYACAASASRMSMEDMQPIMSISVAEDGHEEDSLSPDPTSSSCPVTSRHTESAAVAPAPAYEAAVCDCQGSADTSPSYHSQQLLAAAPVYNEEEMELMDELLQYDDQRRPTSSNAHRAQDKAQEVASPKARAPLQMEFQSAAAAVAESPEIHTESPPGEMYFDPHESLQSSTGQECSDKPGTLTPSSNKFLRRVTGLIQRRKSSTRVYLSEGVAGS